MTLRYMYFMPSINVTTDQCLVDITQTTYPEHFLTRGRCIDFKYEDTNIARYLSSDLPKWAFPIIEEQLPEAPVVHIRVFGNVRLNWYFAYNCQAHIEEANLMWLMGRVDPMEHGYCMYVSRLELYDLVIGTVDNPKFLTIKR